ncbi:MAG TPA: vitamin K epoxide reductase family protein, partial [Ferruginibacter sp.]|nr:vitamin K epoxide reductase family protein [Ferruginibacter sp.]
VYEIDKSNPFVKSLCTAGTQTNCDAVLNSKASGIAGIKWSEAGFFYFAASVLFLFSPALSFAEKIPWLAIGATASAPYIFFSIYYQYKVVKQWCPLCLAVQAVLLIEFVWSVMAYWQGPVWLPVSTVIGITILTSILLPVMAWFFVKPLLHKTKNVDTYEAAYKRLLYNPDYFNQLLQQQQEAPGGWQQLGITLGNPNAANTILKVCNPYCGPCGKAHPELEEIIAHNKDFNLRVIFTATSSEDDRANKPVTHLLAIAANNNTARTQQALDDWYNADKKDYEAFAAKYPMNGELKKQAAKIDAMDHWCREAGIAATPTIFINGRLLPQDYNINELKNIL